MAKTPITVAHGDGIGPEIMAATLQMLDAAGAQLEIETIEIGEQVYLRGVTAGIEDKDWASIRRTGVFLKAPITTPFGGGYKSLNVTTRKTLGLFANVRPYMAYSPFVKTHFPKMDMVIVRENEEDLYAGIEYQHTPDVMECLKLISRQGCERISRYAFEYARANGRKKVTCMIKDNIMKMTDGLFYKVFAEIAKDYPDIENDRMIIDIGTAKIAADPERFDVVVAPNLYGDIISDVAAEVMGSVGLGGSANIGMKQAMFEAVHGSAPDIAGKGIANPSGLLLGAIMMLVHIGQNDVATKLHNAWLKTLEDGIHTGDIYKEGVSTKRVGTKEFSDAVIARLGQVPTKLPAMNYPSDAKRITIPDVKPTTGVKKELVGMDVYIDWNGTPDELAAKLNAVAAPLNLTMISCRGLKLWPNGQPESSYLSHMANRFLKSADAKTLASTAETMGLLQRINEAGLNVIKMENLFTYDGVKGFTAGQGE
ncbi:MAG TPA: NADP-dependent isocitrate dehydrogenase [Alphaproteobacteria bacterium]